jgi:hypothetical protein
MVGRGGVLLLPFLLTRNNRPGMTDKFTLLHNLLKIFSSLSLLLLTFLCNPVKAQDATDGFGLMKESWQVDKRLAMARMMHFSNRQANDFWPVYDRYMIDWCRILNDRISNIIDHYDDYINVTAPPKAQYKDLFADDDELNKLKRKTYRKVRRILPASKAKLFMQVEYIFQMVLSREVQEKAMFIGYATNKL